MEDQDSGDVFVCCDDGLAGADAQPRSRRSVYYSVRLPDDCVDVSLVLDGMRTSCAPGLAKLPDVVAHNELLLWSKSTPDSPPPRTEDLATVLRVADALSDKRMPAWTAALGERAAKTSWNTKPEADTMHAALLSLPPNIRTSALQHMLGHSFCPLNKLPPTLHLYAVAAMITPAGQLLPRHQDSHLEFLAQLRSLPGSGHPPLQSLNLVSVFLSPSTCHVIADALSCHSRLSELFFKLPPEPPALLSAMHILCPSFASATALRALTIINFQYRTPLEALAPLARALPAVAALEYLCLGGLDCCKPTEDDEHPSAVPMAAEAKELREHWRQLLTAVACHPSLTHLSLAFMNAFEPLPWPDAFPRLQHLSLSSIDELLLPVDLIQTSAEQSRKAPQCHPHVPALSKLTFDTASARAIASSSLKPFWLPIGTASQLCLAMRSLTVHIDGLDRDDTDQVWRAFSGIFDVCPGLEELDLSSCQQDIMAGHAWPRLRSLPGLTSLALSGSGDSTAADADVAAAAISGLSSLRGLSLVVAGDASSSYALRAVQSLAAGQLTDLTRLKLIRGNHVAAIPDALRACTGLRSVHLEQCVMSAEGAKQLCCALCALPHLQDLQLHSTAVPEAGVRILAEALPRLRALTLLSLRRAGDGGAIEMRGLVRRLAAELRRAGCELEQPLRLVHGLPAGGDADEVERGLAGLNIQPVQF